MLQFNLNNLNWFFPLAYPSLLVIYIYLNCILVHFLDISKNKLPTKMIRDKIKFS